jgi:urease accessory protein
VSTATDACLRTGRTTIRVEADAERVRVDLAAVTGTDHAPVVRPLLIDSGRDRARVSLVPEGALLLAGDAIELHVSVGAGVLLELVEPGGTVADAMDGDLASWSVEIDVADGGALLWRGEPFVVAAGADVTRTTRVRLGAGAAAVLRETVVLGRHGEPPGTVRLVQKVTAVDGTPILVEDLHLDPAAVGPLLGGHRVVGSVLALGLPAEAPVADAPGRFDLESGDLLLRTLTDAAHLAHDAGSWDQLVRAICSWTSNSMPRAAAR